MRAATDFVSLAANDFNDGKAANEVPWYQVTRWRKVNITEKDPAQHDMTGGKIGAALV